MSDSEKLSADEEKAIEEVYRYAMSLKEQGVPSFEIKEKLVKEGLTAEAADRVVQNMNRVVDQAQRKSDSNASGGGGKSKVPGILIWVGILILINILSAAFDWGFWIY